MNELLDWAHRLPPLIALGWLILMNVATFTAALMAGRLATRWFRSRQIGAAADPVTPREWRYAGLSVVVNTLVTYIGWRLWTWGVITIRRDMSWRAALDFAVLLLLMDLGMYVLHRVAHSRWFMPIHRLHHEFDRPHVLTLFVVHPIETFGFGLLWLLVLCAYSSSWLGISLYVTANLAAGALGHLGVEPFPRWWTRTPVLRQIGTSTFHAQHHQQGDHNFGFYTVAWDRLCGTLAPWYDASFAQVPQESNSPGAMVSRSMESPNP